MAEIRKLIVNSERKNSQGFIVPNNSLKFEYWFGNRNGQVTYNPQKGGHDGAVVVGTAIESTLRLEEVEGKGTCWVVDCRFAETEYGKEVLALYDAGAVTATSLESRQGVKVHKLKDGTKYVAFAEMNELCMVWAPANADTVIKFEDFGYPSDYVPAEYDALTLCGDPEEIENRLLLSEEDQKRIGEIEAQYDEAERLRLEEEEKAKAEAEAERLRLEEEEKAKEAERLRLAAEADLAKLEKPINPIKQTFMNRPLKEVLADTVAHQNFVSQTLRLEEGQPIALEEGAANYRKELAQAIGEHHAAKYIASRVKFGDAKYRSRGMNEAQSLTGTELCNRIAFAEEGVNLPTEIANLDNTRINFLSVVLKGLLSDDAFMRMFRLIDAQEITGAGAMIWTESDIKQYSTALGVIAPLGWQGALVKDKPRYMVRQVLANKPIIFRRSTDSKLPYDKMSFDMSEYQRVMQGNVHSWLLDQICRAVLTAGQTNPRLLFATSGDVVNTGTPNPMFPNHLPTSARDIMSVTRSDIGAVKSRIRLQNFEGNPNIVMQESIAQTMYNDIDVRTQMSFRGTPTDEWLDQFLGVNLYKRDKVTAIETSGTTPAWAEVGLGYGYITNPDTGAVTALNPTITATMIDGFLAAGEGAAVMGIGAINVWETMMPENYGIEFSMDISLGCAPAYEGCEGLLVGVPSMGITA